MMILRFEDEKITSKVHVKKGMLTPRKYSPLYMLRVCLLGGH